MLNRQYAPPSSSFDDDKPTLSCAVRDAVGGYFNNMGSEPIRDLYSMVLAEVEVPLLTSVLKYTNNNQSQTASILGLNRGTLRKKLKKYGML
ncbi:MAG: hypothetical protein KDI19_01195 [Pseudomonadales bacterium]|nr:hypothetical protein [Pseudomonadales bacterium]